MPDKMKNAGFVKIIFDERDKTGADKLACPAC